MRERVPLVKTPGERRMALRVRTARRPANLIRFIPA